MRLIAVQPALDRYLDSAGTAADRAAVLAGAHWTRAYQDGRSSTAMLDLVETLRQLRHAGLSVGVFGFDVDPHPPAWNERDKAMAERILARAAAQPDALILTLSGNLHNRTVPGLPWDATLVPMGVHVKAGHARVTSLNNGYTGGSAWICQEQCGATEIPGKPEFDQLRIDLSGLGSKAAPPGTDGIFSLGTVTASPPATAATE